MKEYIIAMKLLKINNSMIIEVLELLSTNEFQRLFSDRYNEIIEGNINLLPYIEYFEDRSKVKQALNEAEEIVQKSKEMNIKILTINQRNYPSNLKKLKDAPVVLYIKEKNYSKNYEKALACVGTRNPSEFSKKAVDYMVPNWVREDFTIVGGLAEGVDTLAHKKCLENGGKTIAVLAHGLDMIYPKSNEVLAKEIVSKGGLLVSEYPVGTKPEKHRFIERNRIIVGLSEGTVVFECKEKSGTMHSVEYSIEQKKPIFYPNPGNEPNIYLDGIRSLINRKVGYMIENGNNFEKPIMVLGYDLKKSPLRLKQLKKIGFYKIIQKIIRANPEEEHDIPLSKEDTKRVSIEVNRENYERFKEIAKENNLSIKELMNLLIDSIVK